jgi:hypothetical protein
MVTFIAGVAAGAVLAVIVCVVAALGWLDRNNPFG